MIKLKKLLENYYQNEEFESPELDPNDWSFKVPTRKYALKYPALRKEKGEVQVIRLVPGDKVWYNGQMFIFGGYTVADKFFPEVVNVRLEDILDRSKYANIKMKKSDTLVKIGNKKGIEEISPSTPPAPSSAMVQKMDVKKPSGYVQVDPLKQKTEKLDPIEAAVAATVWTEWRNNNTSGMQAVLNVIMNRANGNFNKAKDVVFAKNQFSGWNSFPNKDEAVRNVVQKHKDDPIFKKIVELVKKAKEGNLSDITKGATAFYNPLVAKKPSWVDSYTKTLEIGNKPYVHYFYKKNPTAVATASKFSSPQKYSTNPIYVKNTKTSKGISYGGKNAKRIKEEDDEIA